MNKAYIHILLCLCVVLLCSTALYGQVVINQIMYDSPYNEQVAQGRAYSNGEFVELYNLADTSVCLAGWTMNGDGKTEVLVLDSITLPSHGYLVVAYRHIQTPNFALDSIYPLSKEDISHQILYQRKIILSNSGENVKLTNAAGEVVDSIYYDGNANKRKPDRLSADNADSIPYGLCNSLHRLYAHIVADKVVSNNADWGTDCLALFQSAPAAIFGTDVHTFENIRITPNSTYTICVTPLDKTGSVVCDADEIQVADNARARVNVIYYDGLGREVQNNEFIPATDEDIAIGKEYDGLTDIYRIWNPVHIDSHNKLDYSALSSIAKEQYGDDYPYIESRMEHSALHRAKGLQKQGAAWQGHSTQIDYSCNEGNEVLLLQVEQDSIIVQNGYFDYWSLSKTTFTDEDGKTIIQYQDKSGKTILRQQESTYTYYIYNRMGRLYAILPLPSNSLSMSRYPENDDLLRRFAYIYHYDERGNQIYKRLPGCEPIYMVYDKANRMVLQQNGNQRKRGNYWLSHKYDEYGRIAYTAEINVPGSTYKQLIADFAKCVSTECFSTEPTAHRLEDTGYSCEFLQNSESRLLCVYYYDNYDFLQYLPKSIAEQLTYSDRQGYGKQYDGAIGMLTGKRVYGLNDNGYTATAYYYDVQGRNIQTHSQTLNRKNNHTYTAYSFSGEPLRKLCRHDTIAEYYAYTYNQQGQLMRTEYQVDNGNSITLCKNTYNSIGLLVGKLRHNGRDSIIYQYNVQGNLSRLTSGDYRERLYYCDSLPQYVSPNYNGNISAIISKQAGAYSNQAFSYDKYNRLTQTYDIPVFTTPTLPGVKPFLVPNEKMEYDYLGNILYLERRKQLRGMELVDGLDYEYDGNQVVAITDSAGSKDLYNTYEYADVSSQIGETHHRIEYDENGNMISDYDRGISAIRYNILNLPDTIQFVTGEQIINLYDAEGVKYKTENISPVKTILLPLGHIAHYATDTVLSNKMIKWYDGNFEWWTSEVSLSSGSLRMSKLNIYNSEGFIQYSVDNKALRSPLPFYYHKNYMGSVVAVWNATQDTIEQCTSYYTTGIPKTESKGGQAIQWRKYGGKEFLRGFNYNRYDYGFRHYDATIGRFNTFDPLAEISPWQSPYIYANNNWANQTDWMGLMGVHYSGKSQRRGFIVIDENGDFIGGVDDNDPSIYLSKDRNWREEDGTEGLERVGFMDKSYADYMSELLQNEGKIKASGYYYTQSIYSFNLRFGLSVEKSFFSNKGKILKETAKIGINLMSFDIVNISTTDWQHCDVNYWGRNGKATVSIGCNFFIFGISEQFDIKLNDELSYVPGSSTESVTIGSLNICNENKYIFSFSDGKVLTWEIIIEMNKYYE